MNRILFSLVTGLFLFIPFFANGATIIGRISDRQSGEELVGTTIYMVQDGFNKDSTGLDLPQNFKYIDWRDIAASFNPPLSTDTIHYLLLK